MAADQSFPTPTKHDNVDFTPLPKQQQLAAGLDSVDLQSPAARSLLDLPGASLPQQPIQTALPLQWNSHSNPEPWQTKWRDPSNNTDDKMIETSTASLPIPTGAFRAPSDPDAVYAESVSDGSHNSYASINPATGDSYSHLMPPPPSVLINSTLHIQNPSPLSREKWVELSRFIHMETDHPRNAAMEHHKVQLMNATYKDPPHPYRDPSQPLSYQMMQWYIQLYWKHFHPQLPILHQAGFVADKTSNLLLLVLVTIGAACLDRLQEVPAVAHLPPFLAWHLRNAIFNEIAILPCPELWMIQALLLLEMYEAVFSTWELHLRGRLHHGTTISLMRRCHMLPITQPNEVTPDIWKGDGISAEAIRRCVFAAFVLDWQHAMLFGTIPRIMDTEIHLPLPCDERVWAAKDSTEACRIDYDAQANGAQRIGFEGLRRMRSGYRVHTNPFGRLVLMTGMQCFSYRRLRYLRWAYLQGEPKADDIWCDFVGKLENSQRHCDGLARAVPSIPYPGFTQSAEDLALEWCTALYHLIHMTLHPNIINRQNFDSGWGFLTQPFSPEDFENTTLFIQIWARRPEARHATFYSLRFLSKLLLMDLSSTLSGYSAHNDLLPSRPWVLFFAALIVWSYGYALEGPALNSPNSKSSLEELQKHMLQFLVGVGNISAPEDLVNSKGINGCAGLLLVLEGMFRSSRWEMLNNAGTVLGMAAKKVVEGM